MKTSNTTQPRTLGAELRRLPRVLTGIREPLTMNLRTSEPCRIPARVPTPARQPASIGIVLASSVTLALGLALALAIPARASSSWERTADGGLVDVTVLVDGAPAPLFVRPGSWDRRYFQAFRGRNYALSIANHTGERAGVLISVDGLNVVNGGRSSLSNTEPMYVLGPYERAVIRGWRTSLHDVRRFVFVDEERSYAERTGQANGDLGWIRVLSFREQRPQVWIEPRVRGGDEDQSEPYGARTPREEGKASPSPTAAPSPSGREARTEKDGLAKPRAESFQGQPAPESNPGTGWGERRWDPAQRTVFLADQEATDHIILRYEYESGLRALGIFPRHNRTWWRERGELGWGFSPPPRW